MNEQASEAERQNSEQPSSTQSVAPGNWGRLALLLVVVCVVAIATWKFGGTQSILNALADRESQLREFQADHPVFVYAMAFLIYVVVTGLSLPGAAALTMVYGWFFKFWPALILVSFSSTTGATAAFLLSRYLFRDAVQRRFGDSLSKFNEALEREGAFYLLTLRLIVAVPFFVINLVMGLTPIRTSTYWWVSQIGMLPGTAVFVFAGTSFPSLEELAKHGVSGVLRWEIAVAFALLGLFPITVKKLMALRSNSTSANGTSAKE